MTSYSLPPKRTIATVSRFIAWFFVGAVVLAIFASAVPLKFTSRVDDARIAATKADVAELAAALDRFRADAKRYPTSTEGLAALWSAPQAVQNWHGPYSGKPVVNDPWGHPYIYRCPSIHHADSFDLLSVGRDGREGGGDDISN